jgi:hypothetical protein
MSENDVKWKLELRKHLTVTCDLNCNVEIYDDNPMDTVGDIIVLSAQDMQRIIEKWQSE